MCTYICVFCTIATRILYRDRLVRSATHQGRIQDFLKGGSESGVDIEGGANPSIVSLKQGVWGAQPPRSYMGYLILDSTKIPKNARL